MNAPQIGENAPHSPGFSVLRVSRHLHPEGLPPPLRSRRSRSEKAPRLRGSKSHVRRPPCEGSRCPEERFLPEALARLDSHPVGAAGSARRRTASAGLARNRARASRSPIIHRAGRHARGTCPCGRTTRLPLEAAAESPESRASLLRNSPSARSRSALSFTALVVSKEMTKLPATAPVSSRIGVK